MWFADKLGPAPKGTPQGKAHPQAAQPAAAQQSRNAAPSPKGQSQAKPQPRPAAAPAPEPPKKKKGWF